MYNRYTFTAIQALQAQPKIQFVGVKSVAHLTICWVPYLIKHSGESREGRKLLNWVLKEALAGRVGRN